MPILGIIIGIEMLVGIVLANTSVTSPIATTIRHTVGQVLSEETTTTPEPTPTDAPTETQTPAPTGTPMQAPIEAPAPTETPTPIPETPTPIITPPQETSTQGPISTETPTEMPSVTPETISANPAEAQSPSPTPEVSENQNIQAVVNSGDIISTPHEIDHSNFESGREEDTKIEAAQTPTQEVELLTEAVAQKAVAMDATIKEDDFSTTSFLTQRLTAQIEQATDILHQVKPATQQELKKSLNATCSKTDELLKTEQLSVPEDLEPDIEIARGICLTLQP